MRKFGSFLLFLCLTTSTVLAEPKPIDQYITESWSFLERGIQDYPKAAEDPKLGKRERYPVYISSLEDRAGVLKLLETRLSPQQRGKLELRVLDKNVVDHPQIDGGMDHQGLLYLPHPYVVPGGRFNEMYGWDSYFINVGLLASDRVDQARMMVENHLYQVKHYGRILNANRTYYLTRSQPPFLATMVSDVFEKTGDKTWLKEALPALESTYAFWTTEPHLTPETGLSRYYDLGEGPAPEVLAGEQDESGQTHYDRIKLEFRKISKLSKSEQDAALGYPLALYYDAESDKLTPLFYKGDRSMRESGYDPSDRFGRFNIDVIHYNPVDLNSLLYHYELDMARIQTWLDKSQDAKTWFARATERKAKMQKYLWNEEKGLFFDHNVRTGQQRHYPFATTYFPLWTDWATENQAARIYENANLFVKPGGVVTSTHRSGNQWDSPFGWAPLQMVAALGLDRYGYSRQATEIARGFNSLVRQEYDKSETIVEKYDVVNRTSRVSDGIEFGYSSNEIGFGWTNAVYLVLKRLE